MSETTQDIQKPVDMVADLTMAYLSNNHVPASEIPSLIHNLHATIGALISRHNSNTAAESQGARMPSQAEIRKSISREGIVSFVDGKSYKTLKRHLTKYGFDPDSYRARYGLPPDYPMVAAGHAERRSALAKAIGLGTRSAKARSKS